MNAPEECIAPKSRQRLWRETVFGAAVAAAGGVLVKLMIDRPEHPNSGLLIWLGIGMIAFGFFAVNKKLSLEWMAAIRQLIPFLKKEG